MLTYISRCSGRLIGVATVAILAGCGVTMNGAVVGVPPSIAPGAVLSATDPAIGRYQQSLIDELNQAAANQGGRESQLLQAQFNALANDHTLIGAEKIDALRKFGATQIAMRQALVTQLIADVQSRQHLNAGQRAVLITNLQTVSAHLASLGNAIAQEVLVDKLRADTISIATTTNVYGVVQPIVHLAAAADSMLAEASLLAQHGQQVYATILQNGAGDPNQRLEVAAYRDLGTKLATVTATANNGVGAVLGFVVGNDATATTVINNERSLMSSVLGGFGPFTGAHNDLNQLRGWSTWKPSVPAAALVAPVAALPVSTPYPARNSAGTAVTVRSSPSRTTAKRSTTSAIINCCTSPAALRGTNSTTRSPRGRPSWAASRGTARRRP